MTARWHGTQPEDFPRYLQRVRQFHREDLISTQQTADGWEIRCAWWHTAVDGAMVCVPPREDS